MSESLTAKVQRTSGPINRQAAKDIGVGLHYIEREFRSELLSETPLETRPYPKTCDPKDNLAGQRFGRLTAIGLSAFTNTWIVRCDCGRYLCRRAKTLKGGMDRGGGMCSRCDFEEKRRLGVPSVPFPAETLHKASLPMYEALVAILRDGLTPSSRFLAEGAIALLHMKSN